MSFEPGNIGKATMKVEILSRSPFNSIPQQEFGYFFTRDNLSSMSNVDSIYALPPPFNGYRIIEDTENYDNYLVDKDGIYLEDAVLEGSSTPVDSAARENAAIVAKLKKQMQGQKEFFTWQICENLFLQSSSASSTTAAIESPGEQAAQTAATKSKSVPNPPPASFKAAAKKTDNTPLWTYNLKVKPGANFVANALSPFMIRSAVANDRPVHWGVSMRTSLAKNQPFEIFFYHEGQVHTIAETADLNCKFANLEELKLATKAYLAVEIGKGSPHNYLMLFVQDLPPRFYRLGGKGQTLSAGLISEFTEFSGDQLFNLEHFTVKVEPVVTGLMISSNMFHDAPWIINGSGSDPIFIGQGPLTLYSGNVQAGFLMRPVQYRTNGTFDTPPQTIVQAGGDSRSITFTTAVKGTGDVEQISSYNDQGAGEVHAVDSEKVNGASIKTFIEAQTGERPLNNGNRKIKVGKEDLTDANQTGNSGGSIRKKKVRANVHLTSTDVPQGNGYLVKNGRSPYIWQLRGELPLSGGGATVGDGTDISCDVLSCDLAWNATSYNEFSHSGSLKVINKPRTLGLDYRNYTNRAVYFRISAWWENGVGHDPGGEERVIFEGMSTGTSIETTRERETITFKLEDYMNALEGGKFILSPYYDGMAAPLAVRDIVRQLGVPDGSIMGGDSAISADNLPADAFVLPFSSPLEEPQFRFKDGSSYKAAVVRLATLDGKTVYFDNHGRFHYDDIPGGIFGDENTAPKVDFFTSIFDAPTGKQACWNMSSFSRAVNDTYNVLQVSSVDKETGAIIHLADANEASLHDPTAEGYLGYRKHLLIKESALGSVAAAGRYFQSYRQRVFIPPLTARFETYGYSGLKPLDTVTLDGQKLRVLNIQVQLNKQDNSYWMNVEGEWFFSAGKWQNPTVTGSPGESPGGA